MSFLTNKRIESSEVQEIKNIYFKIRIPLKNGTKINNYKVRVKDDTTFIEALAMVDKQLVESSEQSPFPIYDGYIHNYLQLFWNPKENKIYEDCGIFAYDPDKKFNPIQKDVNFNLYPETKIIIHPESDC
ncbi:MAG: hypothetical protein GF329_16390 [Candidatus Lokiarchaeota archaeon]|nr:hypothetical protein [Candidatus Lokiarchaeota archaeon]